MSTTEKSWHSLEVSEALDSLKTSPRGLGQEEAQRRLAQ